MGEIFSVKTKVNVFNGLLSSFPEGFITIPPLSSCNAKGS